LPFSEYAIQRPAGPATLRVPKLHLDVMAIHRHAAGEAIDLVGARFRGNDVA